MTDTIHRNKSILSIVSSSSRTHPSDLMKAKNVRRFSTTEPGKCWNPNSEWDTAVLGANLKLVFI